MRREIPAAVIVIVIAAAAIALPAAQQPTFRAEINYVELPVRVLDGKGNFIRDLAQADFQVFEDGKAQTIADFTLIDLPLPAARGAASLNAAAGPLPAVIPAASPAASQIDGRVYLLILDDRRVRPQYSSQLRRIVTGFVRDHMGPGDVAGIVFTSGVKGLDFTGDRRQLTAAIDGFIGRWDGDIPSLDEDQNAHATLKVIEDISKLMAEVKRRHKAVIYVSATLGCAVSRQVTPDRPPPLNRIDPRDTNPASEGEIGQLGRPAVACRGPTWGPARGAGPAGRHLLANHPSARAVPPGGTPKL